MKMSFIVTRNKTEFIMTIKMKRKKGKCTNSIYTHYIQSLYTSIYNVI